MRQRVMIAMALSCQPELIIADEPTTALDVTIQAQILELLKDLKAKHNTALLLITHDLGVIAEMAEEVAVMYAGKIVEYADVVTLFKQPKHPYTQGLLHSIPMLATDRSIPLNVIKGTVPNLLHLPAGCRFAPALSAGDGRFAASASRACCLTRRAAWPAGSTTRVARRAWPRRIGRKLRWSCRYPIRRRSKAARLPSDGPKSGQALPDSRWPAPARGRAASTRSTISPSRSRRAKPSAWSASPAAARRRPGG